MVTWNIRKTNHEKFPYKLDITENKKSLLSLYLQDRWPGQKGNIFCLRNINEDIKLGEVVENIPIMQLRRYGKKLSILLNRANKKRCDFLFLEKQYKNKEGAYEQIFFRTQTGISQHKSRSSLQLHGSAEKLDIIIDSNERYSWDFNEHNCTKKSLIVGDYALMIDDKLSAVVERKTFENMLSDVGKIQILHQQLSELSLYPHSAMVIEAQYGDFLNKNKIKSWSVSHIAKVFAEITVLHPKLPIIYAGNRKEANQWTLRFFEGVKRNQDDKGHEIIKATIAKSRITEKTSDPVWLTINKIVEEMPEEFTTSDVYNKCSGYSLIQIRKHLSSIFDTGKINKEGKGRATVWSKEKQLTG